MYYRQEFPIVVNMGNGLGQSLFLRVTQEDRSASSDNHSFEAHSCEKFRRMVYFGGWCKTVISFGNGLDSHSLRQNSFSPSCTLFSVGGMAQIGEWSRFNNQG
jgi:hypothetical protein